MTNQDNITEEGRSHEVNDIIGAPPSFIVRAGSALLLLVVVSLFVLAYLIKYPDTISAKITLTTIVPPIDLVTKSSGKLKSIMIRDNDQVKKDEVLAILENTGDVDYTLFLDSLLTVATPEQLSEKGDQWLDETKNLGELQSEYSALLTAIENIKFLNDANYKEEQSKKIKNEIQIQKQLMTTYENKKRSSKRELELARQKFTNDKNLYTKGIISARELNESESAFLRIKSEIDNIEIAISQSMISVETLNVQLSELSNSSGSNLTEKSTALNEALLNLKSKILAWKNAYLITSPINGKVTLYNQRHENQFVDAGQILMTISPQNEKFIGKISLPVSSSGKVETGQKVIIKLDNFPYYEFGSLEGKISSISEVPQENKYLADVELVNNNITSYGKSINMKQAMSGSASIITKENRFIYKIFYQLKYLTSNKSNGNENSK